VIKKTYGKCTRLGTVAQQIVFYNSSTFTGVGSCMQLLCN